MTKQNNNKESSKVSREERLALQFLGQLVADEDEQLFQRLENDPSLVDYPPAWDGKYLQAGKEEIKRIARKKSRQSILRKAALFFICLCVGGTVLVSSSEAFRAHVFTLLRLEGDGHIIIQTAEVDLNSDYVKERYGIDWRTYYFPSYLPENLELEESIKLSDNSYSLTFRNPDDEWEFIIFDQYSLDAVSYFDTEYHEVKDITINGHSAAISSDDVGTSVLWTTGYRNISLSTSYSEEETIKIAESVILLK